ncbi:MAG: hypothetical protein J6W75_01150 [Bacteroidaceae bacterium]|nr:hypothetical protein [Bacteroidaceae bacterium]
MKTSHYITLSVATLLAVSAITVTSCSDEWDKHYEGNVGDGPTLYELIKADNQLNQFCRVIEHIGYDKVLGSPQSLTVWAPRLTEAEADSIIALYDEQKVSLIMMPDSSMRYIQDKDNKAITQFVQNHIALFGRSVYAGIKDSICMMNGKYMLLQENQLNGIPFTAKNIVGCNGILYKLDGKQQFMPNVREFVDLNGQLRSLYQNMFRKADEYNLDESASVQRGIVDGKIVYADSVLTLSNQLYRLFGWINREDSLYLFLAPSDSLVARELPVYKTYFNYKNTLEGREQLATDNAWLALIRGRFFNLRDQKSIQDSICNTLHRNSANYYGLNVFKRPYDEGGILHGLTPWSCSNGQVMIDTIGLIDPKLTFLENRYILASSPAVRKTPQIMVGSAAQPQVSVTVRSIRDSITYNGKFFDFRELKEKSFMEMKPISYSTSNPNSSMYFYLQNTYSNLYYNVYLVTVPAFASTDFSMSSASTDVLPTRFQVYYNERLATPRTSVSDNPNDDVEFTSPTSERALDVPDGQDQYKSGGRYFLTSGNDIDIICIDRARKPELSGYNLEGTSEPVMRYRVTSNVRTPDLTNYVQTNVMRINRLIYIPFTTEEEANNFVLDLSNLKEFNVIE